MKIKLLIVLLLLLIMPTWALAQNSYSLYLVRHAEKELTKKDPQLTACGRFRAQQLATLLEKTTISAIYSTPYQRTLATAKPLSNKKNIAIRSYSPKDLEQFALHLTQLKESALIVGHSNTTPMLTQLLSKQPVTEISEKQYQTLFQIQFAGEEIILTEFKQPLTCQ
jgi:phosphohistidine phosphatase SixA